MRTNSSNTVHQIVEAVSENFEACDTYHLPLIPEYHAPNTTSLNSIVLGTIITSPYCLHSHIPSISLFLYLFQSGSPTFPSLIPRKANVNVLRKSRSSSTRRYSSSSNPITKHTNTHRCQIERDNTEVKALFSYLSHLYRAGCGVEETSPNHPISQNQNLSSPFANKANHSQHNNEICATGADKKHENQSEILPTAQFVVNSLSLCTSVIKEEEVLNNLFFSNYPFLTTFSVPNKLSDDEKRLHTSRIKSKHLKSYNNKFSNSIGTVESAYSPFLKSGILPLHILLKDLPGVVLNVNQKHVMSPFLAAMKYLESVNEGFHGMTFSESKDLSNENENENNCDVSNNIDYQATNGSGNGKIINIDKDKDTDVITIEEDMDGDRLKFVLDVIESGNDNETVEKVIKMEGNINEKQNKNGNHAEYSTGEVFTKLLLPELKSASELEKNNYTNTPVEIVGETFSVNPNENTTMMEDEENLNSESPSSAAVQTFLVSESDARTELLLESYPRSSILMPMCNHDENLLSMKDMGDLGIQSVFKNETNPPSFHNDFCLTGESVRNLKKYECHGTSQSEYTNSVDLVGYYKYLLSMREIKSSVDVHTSTCLPSRMSSSLHINASTCAFLGPEMPFSTTLTAAINYLNSCERSTGPSSEIQSEEYLNIDDIVIIKSEPIPMQYSEMYENNDNGRNAFLSPPSSSSGIKMISEKNFDTSAPSLPTRCSSSFSNASSSSFSSFYIAASSSSSSFSSSSSSSSSFRVEGQLPVGGLPKIDDFISDIVRDDSACSYKEDDNANINANDRNNFCIDTSSSSSDKFILLSNNLQDNNSSSSSSSNSSRIDFSYRRVQTYERNQTEIQPLDSGLLLSLIPPFYLSPLSLTSQDLIEFKNKLNLDHDGHNGGSNLNLNSKKSSNNESIDEGCSDLRLSGVENAIRYLQLRSKSNIHFSNFQNSDLDNTSSEECSVSAEDPVFGDSNPIISSGECSAAEAALIDISKAVRLSDRILNLKDYLLWGHPTQLGEEIYNQNLRTDSNHPSAAFSDLLLSMEVDILHFGEVVREQIRRSQYPLSLSLLDGTDGGKGSVLTPVEIDSRGDDREKIDLNDNNNSNSNNDNSFIDEDANGIQNNLKTSSGSSSTISLYQSIQPLPSVQPLLSLTSFQALPIDTILPSYDDTSGAIALLALMSDCVCFNEFDCYFNGGRRSIASDTVSSNTGEKNQRTEYKRRENDQKIVDSKSTESRKRKFLDDPTNDFSTSRRQQKCPKCGEYKKGHICSYNRRNDFFYAER